MATCGGRACVVPAHPSRLQVEVTAELLDRKGNALHRLPSALDALGPAPRVTGLCWTLPLGFHDVHLPVSALPGTSLVPWWPLPQTDRSLLAPPESSPAPFLVAFSRLWLHAPPRPWSVPSVLILTQAAGRCPLTLQAVAWGSPASTRHPTAERRPSPKTAGLILATLTP